MCPTRQSQNKFLLYTTFEPLLYWSDNGVSLIGEARTGQGVHPPPPPNFLQFSTIYNI